MKKLLTLFVFSFMIFAACASDQGGETEDDGEAGAFPACTEELPADTEVKGVPEEFPKPDGAIYTGGSEAGPSFVLEGVFDGDLSESFEAWEAEFEASGYDITKDEQESKDAEVFFAGEGTTGQVNMFADCADQTKLRITIRPD